MPVCWSPSKLAQARASSTGWMRSGEAYLKYCDANSRHEEVAKAKSGEGLWGRSKGGGDHPEIARGQKTRIFLRR